jgi:membrane-associated phospholipid phosphatase
MPKQWFPPKWGAAAWWVTLAAFVALAVAVGRGATASWDASVTKSAVASRTPTLTHLAVFVSWLGLAAVIAVWAGLLAVALDRRFRTPWQCLLRVLAVLAADVAVVYALKHLVDRERPPVELRLATVSTASFPSGHATATAAAVSMLALCLVALSSSTKARAAGAVAAAVLALAMDWSRVYLGVHYLTDVAAGTLLGLWLTLTTLWAFDFWSPAGATRPATRQPADER